MSYRKYLTKFGSPADAGEIRFSIYLTAPEKLTTAKDISWTDKRIEEEITRLESVLKDLKDYRKDLAARYGELETMPYTRLLKLERYPNWKGRIDYIVSITRQYSDKTDVHELYEVFPGKERKKAFDRTAELLKQNPGIPYEKDIEKRSWER